MKEYTKMLKAEMNKDFQAITQKNNNKYSNRTPEQNEQALNDKIMYYYSKWCDFLFNSETKAQKNICFKMLFYIKNYTIA